MHDVALLKLVQKLQVSILSMTPGIVNNAMFDATQSSVASCMLFLFSYTFLSAAALALVPFVGRNQNP
jgi:hypothetical protein